jgi:hypothetical protein
MCKNISGLQVINLTVRTATLCKRHASYSIDFDVLYFHLICSTSLKSDNYFCNIIEDESGSILPWDPTYISTK